MSASNPLLTVRRCLSADVPCLLWGAPGTGKTAALTRLAREADAHMEVLIGSTLDPADVGGVPVPDAAGRVQLAPPAWARRIRAALDRDQPAWLLLDELSCAPPSVQAALLRVVHERRVGDVDLDGCRVLAGSNPTETAADGGSLAAAAANRWCHVPWHLSASEWCSGELSGWGRATLSAQQAAAAALITGWVRYRPQVLLAVPSECSQAGLAWPSPRSWSAAIRLLGTSATPRALAISSEGAALLGGCVGDAAATECVEWIAQSDLPDPEALLTGAAKLPARGDQIVAALDSLVAAAISAHPHRDSRVRAAWSVCSAARKDVALGAAAALLSATDDALPDEAVGLGRAVLEARAALG